MGLVFKLQFFSFQVKRLYGRVAAVKKKACQSFFIPLPAGLVEIRRQGCVPHGWSAGLFHPEVSLEEPQLSGERWTAAWSDKWPQGIFYQPLPSTNPDADPLICDWYLSDIRIHSYLTLHTNSLQLDSLSQFFFLLLTWVCSMCSASSDTALCFLFCWK